MAVNIWVFFLCFLSHKGTLVICNLSSVLKDPSQWEKPDQFYPEHFLDDRRNFRKREAFYPFSAGRLLLYFTHTYKLCFNVRWRVHKCVPPLHLSREKVMFGWAAGTKYTLPVLHFSHPEVLILSSWRSWEGPGTGQDVPRTLPDLCVITLIETIGIASELILSSINRWMLC